MKMPSLCQPKKKKQCQINRDLKQLNQATLISCNGNVMMELVMLYVRQHLIY